MEETYVEETEVKEEFKCPELLQKWIEEGVGIVTFAADGNMLVLNFKNQMELSGFVLNALWDSSKDEKYLAFMSKLTEQKVLSEKQVEMIKKLQEDPEGQALLSMLVGK